MVPAFDFRLAELSPVIAFGTAAGEGSVKNKQCKSMVPFGPHLNLII